MTMETLWRYMPFISLPIIFFLGLLALSRLPDRIARGSLGGALFFLFMAILVCVSAWLLARLRGEAFPESWRALVLVMGIMLVSTVAAHLWKPTPRGMALFLRLFGAFVGVVGIAILILDRWEISLAFVACMGFAVLYGLVFPWPLVREAREKERLEAQREEEARWDRERLERIRKEERESLERQKGAKPE